ncbi:MAG: hypothetical protein Fur0037_23890 [Planctomycetota bacterium]
MPVARGTAELAASAVTRLMEPELVRARPSECFRMAAEVEQWLDRPDRAIEELERGIRLAPSDAQLHIAYQDLYGKMGQRKALCGAYARMVKSDPGLPILVWYQGRAQVMLADELRGKGAYADALRAYAKARSCFEDYGSRQPGGEPAVAEWLAILDLSSARTATAAGDLDAAQRFLLASDAIGEARILGADGSPPVHDEFGATYEATAYEIGQALADGGEGSLQRALDFYEAILERHPDAWGWMHNNAGLAARDLGSGIEREAGQAEGEQSARLHEKAVALWERSYGHYQKAVRLCPDDPRIINDCGLMLLYHLDRQLDLAQELFEKAIAVGEPKLEALPADASPADRNFLEEAIGDAWQNLAVLAQKQGKPFEDYKAYCEKSLQYYPRRQRAPVLRLLQQGGGSPPAERGKGGPRAAWPAAALGPDSSPGERDLVGRWDEAQDGEQDKEFEELRKKAEALAAQGDLDGALSALDEAVSKFKNHAAFHALRGDYSLRLAIQAREKGRSGVEFLFADAVAELEKSIELDSGPASTRLLLARALKESGEFEKARAAADRLLLHLQSLGGGSPDETDEAHALRAASAARVFVQAGGVNADEALEQARRSFQHLERRNKLDTEAIALWATMEEWAKKPVEAMNVYARALAASPDDQALLSGLVDTAKRNGEAPRALGILEKRTDALGLWYLGTLHFAIASDHRMANRHQETQAELDKAIDCFRRSMQQNASYSASCNQWIAWSLGKKGCDAYQNGDIQNAEKWLLESARMAPAEIATDLGLQESTKMGILLVADKYRRTNDLEHAEAVFRAASEAAVQDGDLANNAGLFARDFGNVLERRGKAEQARAMYQKSYEAYLRAWSLDPTNTRLCNDTALILIYHLEHDWDRAKDLLDRGIAAGEKVLRDDPPRERQEFLDLDEALGDCYENLALWHLKHSGDLKAARQAAEASMRHHPGQGRAGARRHLAQIERREKELEQRKESGGDGGK